MLCDAQAIVTMKNQCSFGQTTNLTYVLPMQSCLFRTNESLGRPRMFTIISELYTARRVRFRYLNVLALLQRVSHDILY